ncbi:MAG: NUDIX domain-containing protein [Alphaproteobacteria bacterium]|nr:NUDIX domain-containing protein [Alphaproteobacteria bacterium]
MSATDNQVHRFPVSIKGVIISDGRVVLLKNERAEWELPGGKLEPREQPRDCLAREIREELNLTVDVAEALDSWLYQIAPGVAVVIVTYGCHVPSLAGMAKSDEHKELATFALGEIAALTMPVGYKASIRHWADRLATTGTTP